MPDLTFKTLRKANRARLPLFRNAQGEIAHTEKDGSDWSPADWFVAMVGELGEAANLMKKIRRGDFAEGAELEMARGKLSREFADVLIYFDIMADQFDIDLGEWVRAKFNEKSAQVKAPIFIKPNHDESKYIVVSED